MKHKRDYITDGYIEDVNHYLYNDIPLTTVLDKHLQEYNKKWNTEFNKEYADSLMKEGEVYVQVEVLDHYIVTSLGRVINTGRKTPVSMTITNTTAGTYAGQSERINLENFFAKQGWHYDHKKIIKDYKKYKWKHRLVM